MTLENKKEKYDIQHRLNNSYVMNFNKMRKNNYHSKLENNIIQPYFDNLEEKLIIYIKEASYVIGCVAWLTNGNIIEALNGRHGVKMIINKEEYLNENMQYGKKSYYKDLRNKYDKIPDMFAVQCKCCDKKIHQCSNFLKIFGQLIPNNEKNINNQSTIIVDNNNSAILTCGIVNNLSKMHHKFLIFFNDYFEPTGLWTGSYNLSNTSNYSLENALYITDKKVIIEYIKEFIVIYPFSEPYNWKSGLLYSSIKPNI